MDAYNESQVQSIKREAEILQDLPPHPNVIQFKHVRSELN